MKESASLAGGRAGIVLTGGNVDRQIFVTVLNGTFQEVLQPVGHS